MLIQPCKVFPLRRADVHSVSITVFNLLKTARLMRSVLKREHCYWGRDTLLCRKFAKTREQEYTTGGARSSWFRFSPAFSVLSSSGVSYSSDTKLATSATLALLREREVIHRALLRRNGVFLMKNGTPGRRG